MNIETIIGILTALFGALMFNMMLASFLEKRKGFSDGIYVSAVFCMAVFIYLSNTLFKYAILNVFITVVLIFIMSLLYCGNTKNRILISIFSSLVMTIIEIIVLYIIALIFGISADVIVSNFGYRLFGIIASKMVSFAVFKIICSKAKSRNTAFLEPSYWILFVVILLTSLFALSVISIPQVTNTPRSDFLAVVCSFGLLFSTFFSVYLYEHMAEQSKELAYEKLANERAVEAENHLKERLVAQNQMRAFKHDLSNHMITLRAYFENRNYQKGINYINVIENFMERNDVINTGNDALDAIINIKMSAAKSKNIDFKANIQIPEDMGIDDIDLSIILGNALDNAIEACEKVQDNKRYIHITIMYDKKSIICKIDNSAAVSNPSLKTTKSDAQNHGIGMERIRFVVDKYNGVYSVASQEDKFILSFVMNEKA